MPNQAPAHWSKDFVEHLRTVHFALIVVSAGLAVLVFSSKQYNAVAALVQLQEIINLKNQWSLRWLEQNGQPDQIIFRTPGFSWRDEYPQWVESGGGLLIGTTQYGILTWNGHSLPVHLLYPQDDWSEKFEVGSNLWPPNAFPATLNQFQSFWPKLQKYCVYLPSALYERWLLAVGTEFDQDQTLVALFKPTDKSKLGRAIELNLELLADYSGTEEQGPPNGAEYRVEFEDEKTGKTVSVRIPIMVMDARKINDETLRKIFDNTKPTLFDRQFEISSFEQRFGDLFMAARDEGDLPLEAMKDFLHDEAAKGPDLFEAFGMKFPAPQITIWGLVLVLSIQLYFFVYLRRLVGKLQFDDPAWDVPWIGMDTSALSNLIFYVSIVIFPVLAASLLGWDATVRLSSSFWQRNESSYPPIHFLTVPWRWPHSLLMKISLLVCASASSACLGLLCWKYRPQIAPESPKPPSCPAQMFE